MTVIRTYRSTKYYGKMRGVKSLDLEIRPGVFFGFPNPNSAGETTASGKYFKGEIV